MIIRDDERFPDVSTAITPKTRVVALVQSEDVVVTYGLNNVEGVIQLKRCIQPWEKIIGLYRKVM